MSHDDQHVRRPRLTLRLADAERILDNALTAGREASLLPLAVAVLDAGGNLVTFKREDGCGILRADIAIGKAWGALGMGASSRTIGDRLSDRPAFQAALAAVSRGRFVAVPGGVLVMDAQSEVLGAVGISGDGSDKDEYCAITAVTAAGFLPDPPQPVPNWGSARL